MTLERQATRNVGRPGAARLDAGSPKGRRAEEISGGELCVGQNALR